jgi:hypothetical protein
MAGNLDEAPPDWTADRPGEGEDGSGLARALPPEVLKAIRRQLRIAHSVPDVFVTEIGLKGTGVVAFIGQREAAGMAEHVRVSLELQPCGFSGTLDHARESRRGEWCPAL